MENYIKKGEKGLKNAFFWAINSKKIAGGGNDQNAQYISLLEAQDPKYVFLGKPHIEKGRILE